MSKLFNKLCNHGTLKSAWRHIRQKGARGGLDGIQTKDLEAGIDKTISGIIRDLRAGRYVPVPYEKGAMPKFNAANEWRKLSLPSVRDKIVQQGFLQLAEPLFEKEFLDCSYAYRRNKGPVKAIKRVEHILSPSIRWAVCMDIDDFFDTMDHDLLMEKIAKKLDEPEMLNLVRLWVNAGMIGARGEWDEPDEGIAQGSVVSPFFSNIYLHDLDQFAVGRKYRYVRYSDNLILLSRSKEAIYAAFESVQAFLKNELRLKLNDNPYPFKSVDKGFVFLGIYFKGDQRKISSAKEAKVFRKLNWLTDASHQKDPRTFLRRLNESVKGTRRYYGFIRPGEQFEKFDQHLIRRLRFLLVHFLRKGMLEPGDGVRFFLSDAEFYVERSHGDREKICETLAREAAEIVEAQKAKVQAKEKKPASPGKTTRAAQTKRQTARKSRFLRQIGGQAEVVVSTPGLFIGKTGERLIIREQRKNVLEMIFPKIRNVSVRSTGVSLSSDVIFKCARNRIPITFYTRRGDPFAVLQSPMHDMGNISVLQIRTYETEKALELVKRMITGKARNQINLMKFYRRSRKKDPPDFSRKVTKDIQDMEKILRTLQAFEMTEPYSVVRDRIFSAEARISLRYWACMKLLVSPDLGFQKRTRHKASDLVNNMLNYGYGILYQRVWQAIMQTGLNPHISFLHAFQAGKPTLVYDLVEEFRQPFADRAVFSMLTRGKKGADLRLNQKTGLLVNETRKKVTRAVLDRLSGLVTFRGKKMKGEDIIGIQARNLVSFLQDKGPYKPFIGRY